MSEPMTQTREAVEELEDDEIVICLARLVGTGVVVSTGCAVEAFSVSHRPDLLSHPFVFPF